MTTVELASQIAAEFCGETVRTCERFTTGLRNWVYDVGLASGRQIVVRMGHPDHRAELAGGVYWAERLQACGVPVATVLEHDLDTPQPYMILERLPGTDLGNRLPDFNDAELARISESVAAMQANAGRLPHGGGFGYALNYDEALESTWLAVLTSEIDRAEDWIHNAGVVDGSYVDRVRTELAEQAAGFHHVEPRAFLHDATTKNVIVDDGRVTGLVDVDTMGFGDPLWAVALTRMSLLSAGLPTTYADMLAIAMGFNDQDRLALYTHIFCLTFLGELGQQFNADEAPTINHNLRRRLESLLTSQVS